MPLPKPNIRTIIAFVHDIAAAAIAWWLAYLFRFNFEIPPLYLASLKEILPWVIPIHAAVFLWFGLYRGLWHYASLPDLRRILFAVLASAAVVPLALFMVQSTRGCTAHGAAAGSDSASVHHGRQPACVPVMEGTSALRSKQNGRQSRPGARSRRCRGRPG